MANNLLLKKYIEPSVHVIVWACLLSAIWYNVQTLGPFRKEDDSIYLPLIWNACFNIILFYVNALFLIPAFVFRHQYAKYILFAFLLYISIVLLNTLFDHEYSLSLFSSEKEPFYSDLFLNYQTKTIVLALSVAYGLTRQWMENERVRQQSVKDKLANELKYLKAQINPHFLFNTLNMAFASASKSQDFITADIIEKLSGLMRYVLYESNEDEVSLEKEIHYINNSVDLQVQRLSQELASQVNYEVKGDWQNYKIAPMILIPFIENVFKHGVILSRTSEIRIRIELDSDTLTLETRNAKSKQPKTEVNASGIGLRNAKERLKLLYPDKHTLKIEDGESHFQVELKIQIS